MGRVVPQLKKDGFNVAGLASSHAKDSFKGRKGMTLNQHGLLEDTMRSPGRVKITKGRQVAGKSVSEMFDILGVKTPTASSSQPSEGPQQGALIITVDLRNMETFQNHLSPCRD